MPTVEILNSHSVKTLRQEIAKSNDKLGAINGYSKGMKKAGIIDLMMKHKDRFHHIKMAEKTVRAPPLKSETAKKISKTAQQPAQQPKIIAPKKRVAKTATVVPAKPKKEKKPMTVTKADGSVKNIEKKKFKASKEQIKEFKKLEAEEKAKVKKEKEKAKKEKAEEKEKTKIKQKENMEAYKEAVAKDKEEKAKAKASKPKKKRRANPRPTTPLI